MMRMALPRGAALHSTAHNEGEARDGPQAEWDGSARQRRVPRLAEDHTQGIVNFTSKTIHLCRKKSTTAGFVLPRTLGFSPPAYSQLSSRGRRLSGIFLQRAGKRLKKHFRMLATL